MQQSQTVGWEPAAHHSFAPRSSRGHSPGQWRPTVGSLGATTHVQQSADCRSEWEQSHLRSQTSIRISVLSSERLLAPPTGATGQ